MKNCYFLLLLFTSFVFGQNRQEYQLRIQLSELEAFPLKVKNTSTNEVVVTDEAGYFKMLISNGDKIVLEENSYYEANYIIKPNDLNQTIIRIPVLLISTELKNVEVQNVTSKSLGLDAAEINKYIYKRNPNPNMDFKALAFWLVNALRKKKGNIDNYREPNTPNPYVKSLPRNIITNYLKIPDDYVDKFYIYMGTDFEVDQYIKEGNEDKWRFYLLEKAFTFLEQEGIPIQR